jgi:hypothetical protein
MTSKIEFSEDFLEFFIDNSQNFEHLFLDRFRHEFFEFVYERYMEHRQNLQHTANSSYFDSEMKLR